MKSAPISSSTRIEAVKKGLRGQPFPENNTTIAAVRQVVRLNKHVRQVLVHYWRKRIAKFEDSIL